MKNDPPLLLSGVRMIKALSLSLLWILFYLCIVDGQSQHQSMVFEQQLSQQTSFVRDVPLNLNRLTIWSVQPGLVGWPVILAGIYNDSAINPGYLTFDWSFPGQDDQSCIQAGRNGVIPCRGSVMERIFDRPSPPGGYNVSLSVSYPGQPVIRTSLRVTVLNALPGPIITRREIRTLPRTEWDRVIRAILELKKRGVYDHLTYIHQVAAFTGTRPGTMRNSAHRGPSLLPWHRAFVRHMERAMQTVLNDNTFAIPYWDWSLDQRTGTPLDSEIWDDRFFGPTGDPNQNYAVPSGHFCGVSASTCRSNWTLPWGLGGPVLERELGRVVRSLPSPVQVINVLAVPTYDVSPFDAASAPPSSFRMALEGSGGTFYGLFHNGVHSWIGGAMASMASPNDPAFWIHHAFVDKLFTQWQRMHNCTTECFRPLDNDPNVTQATPGSQLVGGVWKIKGHHWSDTMYPWSLRIRDVYPFPYDGVYGYQYDSL